MEAGKEVVFAICINPERCLFVGRETSEGFYKQVIQAKV